MVERFQRLKPYVIARIIIEQDDATWMVMPVAILFERIQGLDLRILLSARTIICCFSNTVLMISLEFSKDKDISKVILFRCRS